MPEIADLQSLAVAGEEFVWGGSDGGDAQVVRENSARQEVASRLDGFVKLE